MYLIDYLYILLYNIPGDLMKEEIQELDLEYDLICDFIKLRNDLGLTQKQMAEEAGVIREMIAVIENRKKHPQINTLLKILKPFGYTLKISKIKWI